MMLPLNYHFFDEHWMNILICHLLMFPFSFVSSLWIYGRVTDENALPTFYKISLQRLGNFLPNDKSKSTVETKLDVATNEPDAAVQGEVEEEDEEAEEEEEKGEEEEAEQGDGDENVDNNVAVDEGGPPNQNHPAAAELADVNRGVAIERDEIYSDNEDNVPVLEDNFNENDPTATSQDDNTIEDDLLCPITKDLPFDPVVAEDGHVYERHCIIQHVMQQKRATSKPNKTRKVRSPFTNELMGTRMYSAPWIRNHITTLIEKGHIVGDSAKLWKEKEEKMKENEELREQAGAGDAETMRELASKYRYGDVVLQANQKKAFEWYKRAHEAGDTIATTNVGEMLLNGRGVDANRLDGLMYLCLAAGRGSDWAAYLLACALSVGGYGLTVNKTEAIHLLTLCLSGTCEFQHCQVEYAQEELDKLMSTDN